MRISDWSSDVCSSDLRHDLLRCGVGQPGFEPAPDRDPCLPFVGGDQQQDAVVLTPPPDPAFVGQVGGIARNLLAAERRRRHDDRSEEHTSELQSLMRISYAVFCLKKKKKENKEHKQNNQTKKRYKNIMRPN